jgi:PAS domain S-box-containing protein
VQPTGDAIRVLHVDDEPEFGEMAATFLERADDRLDVETATSADEGLRRLAEGRFECVVSDYEMPGRNGIEFLEAIREDYPDLPFVLFTGRGSEEVASEAISAGVTDYIQKDHTTDQYALLANRIGNAVDGYRSRREVEWQRAVLSNVGEGVYAFDREYVLRYVNFRVGELEEASEAGWTGQSLADLVDEGVLSSAEAERIRDGIDRVRSGDTEEVRLEIQPTVPDPDRTLELRLTAVRAEATTDLVLGTTRDVTEREERERRFRAIFDNTYTFVGLLDTDGRLLEANDTALSFGQLAREDVVGEPIWETHWFQSNDAARASAREAVERAREGDLYRDEIRVQGADEHAVIDFSVRPVTDDDGDVRLLIPEGRNITERKRQERKRAQVIERVTDAIVEVDPEWRFTLVNNQAEELYGMSRESLLGEEFWDVFSEARGTRFEETYREVMTSREPTSFVEHYAGLDGWFDVQVYPNDDGGLAFYFREVTERKRREAQLAQSEARYRALAENFPNGAVFYVDDDFRYRTVSGSGFDPIDTDPEHLEGNAISEVDPFPDAVVDVIRDVHERTLDGHEERVEVAYEDHVYEVRTTPIRDADDDIVAGLHITQDITERKERERELERQNERLDEFASIVGHDLRNPLDAARGRVELAREECDSDHLDEVTHAHDRMESLVDDLLQLARVGEESIDAEPVDVADVVEDCWRTVETADATLVTEVDRRIRADRSRLKQLVENLLRNAVEHGGADVTVTIGGLSDGFYVADDGSGIPAADRDDVFESGYSTHRDGTGFGLAIVREVADVHGWTVRATTGPDGGTRFEITDVDAPEP